MSQDLPRLHGYVSGMQPDGGPPADGNSRVAMHADGRVFESKAAFQKVWDFVYLSGLDQRISYFKMWS